MSTGSNIQDSILKAIDTMAQRRIDQLQLDKTITAIINASVGVKNGRKIYKVEYEGGYFNATAQNKDDAYLPRMAVYVQVPQGDFSKEKFILGQASKLATDEQVSVVSATNNNFSIVGKNVIDNKAEKMGVYSYHSPTEEENSDTLNHRFNFLYKSDQKENQVIPDENLNLYKEDATAIMVRAEFMTKLTNEQKKKATGEYGLVFDLVFNNLAAGLGETQYDVFKHFREKVKANRIVDGETEEFSLDTIDTKLVEALKEKTHTELTEIDGYLDEILSDIQELDRVYKNNNQTEYTFAVQDLISKYTILVQDIKRVEDEEKFRQNMQKLYQNWMDEIIGQPAEKHVSYYLSSNDMIGNPFSFSSWISQYNIFEIDLENFKRIDSILLYKQGFIEDAVKEATWLDHESDILVRDIQVYAMRPLSDNNSGYQLKVEGKDTGFIFEGKESDVNIIANATLLREYFEDLTRNSDTTFYWFKQSENIVSPMQSEYSIYGGIGWSEINNQNSTKLEIIKEDAPAYENHFRCAAVYMGEEVPIVLRYDFIVYNYLGQRFTLQSDLGTNFTFDAGIPTITVYKVITEEIDGKKVERLEELHGNNQYKFKWAIIDGNNQKVFLDTKPELDLTDMTVSNFNNYSNTSKLLKDIKWYRGDTEVTTETDKAYATKIKYPMSNIASSANITFECYISYRKEDEEDFYPLGKTELTLNNFKILNANSYRIWIENGDQVFQYDEYGNAPNVDKYKDPIEVLPLKIHLFAPNNIEVQDSSFRTKWYFPTEESLIIYNSDEAEIDPETNNKNMFRGSEINFNIKELYDNNAFDNQIECQIEFNDQVLYAETALTFTKVGSNGTNGTDMVAKIVPSLSNNVLYEQPLTIYVDKSNENKVFLNTQRKNEAEDVIRITEGVEGILKPLLYQKSTQVDFNNVRWNIAGNTSTGTNKTGKYFSLDNGDIFYNKEFIDNKYRQQIIKSEIKYNSDQTYYAFYSLPIIEYEKAQDNNRIGIRNDTYIKEVLYNSDGRNPLYNHNQGLEILNLPDNCVISWTAYGGRDSSEMNPNFSLLLNADDDKETAIKNIITLGNKIYILPDDNYNGENTNNYIKAEIYKNNGGLNNTTDENQFILKDIWDSYSHYLQNAEELNIKIKNGDDTAIKAKEQLNLEFKQTVLTYQQKLEIVIENSKTTTEKLKRDQFIYQYSDSIFKDSLNFLLDYVEQHKEEIRTHGGLTEEERQFLIDNIFQDINFLTDMIDGKSRYQLAIEEAMELITNIESFYVPEIFQELCDEVSEKLKQVNKEVNADNNLELIATIYAPVHMSLNTFGLASVNAWDGNKVDINEAEDGTGYVMAPQIGAGEKDNNNRFTGILMGKARTNINTTQEENQVGLFGYAHGYQSIFLDAETGNSYFGLPNGKPLVKQGDGWIIGSDDYNEGRIELKPGDISKIGGWRLGRRSLYYTSSGDIGDRYTDSEAEHHTKDINHNDEGILLSAIPAYISIKGRTLTEDDKLDDSPDAQVKVGDSIELQLDPANLTMFGIYRHYKNSVNNKYERVLLSGINDKGQLVANRMEQAPVQEKPDSTKSALGIETFAAFTDKGIEQNYLGLNLTAGPSGIQHTPASFFRFFINRTDAYAKDTKARVHITGGRVSTVDQDGRETNNDYARPISIHAKDIQLYAEDNLSNNNEKDSTDSYIKISKTNLSGKVGDVGFDFNRSANNSINLKNPLTIETNNTVFTLNTATQTIKANGAISITSNAYTINSAGAININTSNSNNIKITRNGGSNIEIQEQWIYNKVGNNNNNMLAITNNTGQTTQLKSDAPINISSGKELILSGTRANMGGGNSDSTSAIVLSSGKSKLRLKDYYSSGASYPLFIDLNNAGSLSAYFPNSNGQTTSAYSEFQVGMNLKTSFGAVINGNYKGTNYGLEVAKAAKFNSTILSSGRITTNTGFTGDGSNITNTASGNGSGSGASISGWGGSGTATFPTVSMNSGRPTFGSASITVSIPSKPTLSELGGITPTEVDAKIAAAVENCLKKDQTYLGSWVDGYHLVSVSGGKDSEAVGHTSESVATYSVTFN